MSEQLTNDEIRTLNDARNILRDKSDGYPDNYGAARCNVMADVAKDALFDYLNNAHTWGGQPLEYVDGNFRPTMPDMVTA
jgi:hypothetical protein